MLTDAGTEEYVDATLFLGMNCAEENVRIACKSYFAARLADRVVMSLEQVGRCDDLVWGFPREVQDAYYPFMDNLHTMMSIDRIGYDDTDLRSAPAAEPPGGLPTHERLLLGMVLNRGGTLRSVSSRLLDRPGLPVRAPEEGPELAFPEPLERLYQQSLRLRLPVNEL
jgi:hypothetical protein